MTAAAKLRNIGPKGMAWLRQTGVRSLEDLREVGALAAYVRVRRAGFKPSLNLLYALEGAILDCHWQQIPDERRTELVGQAEAAVALLPQPKGRRMPAAGPVTTTRNDEDEGAALPDPGVFDSFEPPVESPIEPGGDAE
jgi:hypothetical protein